MRNIPIPELSQKDENRFWAEVEILKSNQCWEWTAGNDGKYGSFGICRNGKTITLKSHRVAYFIAFAVDAGALDVCHHCDNPPCCNPEHLFIGTRSDNLQDMIRKNRRVWKGMPGETNHRAKLSDSQVLDIRKRYSEGEFSQRAAALEFDVAHSLISRIVIGSAWPHLPMFPLKFSSRKGMRRKPEMERIVLETIAKRETPVIL